MKNIYIVSRGKLYRKENTLWFISEDKNKIKIPIKNINAIYIFNKVSLTSNAIHLLFQNNIPVHFFKEDKQIKVIRYLGSLFPKQKHPAGIVHIKQAKAYLDNNKRTEIALEIIDALRYNMIKVLEKYPEIKEYVFNLRNLDVKKSFNQNISDWKSCKNIILGIESNLWNIFYEALDKVLKYYKLERRTKRPPKNEANAVISFINSLLYVTVLSEIYKTHLDPTISFLHEPYERRFSLALDLSEPFKPIITYRSLIWLVNQGILKPEHFRKEFNGILLSNLGIKLVLKEFDSRIKETVKIKGKGRKSFLIFIRKQCYNLERSLIEESPFEAFRLRY